MSHITSLVLEQLSDPISQKILAAFGIARESPEKQAQFLEDAGALVMQGVVIEIMQRLPESALSEFGGLIEKGNESEWREFLSNHIQDHEVFIEEMIKKEVATIQAESVGKPYTYL